MKFLAWLSNSETLLIKSKSTISFCTLKFVSIKKLFILYIWYIWGINLLYSLVKSNNFLLLNLELFDDEIVFSISLSLLRALINKSFVNWFIDKLFISMPINVKNFLASFVSKIIFNNFITPFDISSFFSFSFFSIFIFVSILPKILWLSDSSIIVLFSSSILIFSLFSSLDSAGFDGFDIIKFSFVLFVTCFCWASPEKFTFNFNISVDLILTGIGLGLFMLSSLITLNLGKLWE